MSSRAMDGISHAGGVPPPTNPMVTVLLTDMYQLTMAYAYWKAGKHNESAVFDLMFRKNPFGGEYTVFAGLEECIRFAGNFRFKDDEIAYVRTILPPSCEDEFFEFLKGLDCSEVEIYAIPEGSVVFPRVPLIRVEGPLLIAQLLETTFLTLVNYASLVATNAARHRRVAGKSKILLEFGLRRAQGPDGGISASKYCYIGGFDATSNVDAGRRFGIPVRGTHSHAFVSAFMSFDEITERSLPYADGSGVCKDFVQSAQHWLSKLRGAEPLRGIFSETNSSELAAFTSYALAFPSSFQALVDTYDVMRSGIPNFCAVALALQDLGYRALGIRLDSGDLSYLSLEARRLFKLIEDEFKIPGFGKLVITASNDINEETLDALNKQGHEVDAFGIGTHLVTCFQQPALGCVYKLVEINGQPRIKLSEDLKKVTIPCKKQCYRLYGKEGFALVDLLTGADEKPPEVGERILCRHPFSESKRAYVVPQRVEPLYKCFWSTKPGSPCSRSTCVALQDGENSRSSTLFPCRQHASHCRGEAGRILILRAIETALPGAAGCNEARPHAWTEPHSVQGERQWKTVRFHPFSMAKRSTDWGTFVTGFVVVYFIFLPTLLVGSILVAFSYVVLLTHGNLKKLFHCFEKLDMIQVSFQFHKTYRYLIFLLGTSPTMSS